MLLRPLYHEVGEHLGLDHRAGGVCDVEAYELKPPFGDVTHGLSIVYDIPEAAGGHDHHRCNILDVKKQLKLDHEHHQA